MVNDCCLNNWWSRLHSEALSWHAGVCVTWFFRGQNDEETYLHEADEEGRERRVRVWQANERGAGRQARFLLFWASMMTGCGLRRFGTPTHTHMAMGESRNQYLSSAHI